MKILKLISIAIMTLCAAAHASAGLTPEQTEILTALGNIQAHQFKQGFAQSLEQAKAQNMLTADDVAAIKEGMAQNKGEKPAFDMETVRPEIQALFKEKSEKKGASDVPAARQKELMNAFGQVQNYLFYEGMQSSLKQAVAQKQFTQEEADAMKAGFEKGFAEEKSAVDAEKMIPRIEEYLKAKGEAAAKAAQEANAKIFADLDKNPNIKKTDSGLRYEILAPGEAASHPKATDTVRVHYRGTFFNGDEFDSSYKRGQTIDFPLNGVIPAWTEGLQLIGKGGKLKLYAPSELAYGEHGAGPIPPNTPLQFEVELIDVNPPAAEK